MDALQRSARWIGLRFAVAGTVNGDRVSRENRLRLRVRVRAGVDPDARVCEHENRQYRLHTFLSFLCQFLRIFFTYRRINSHSVPQCFDAHSTQLLSHISLIYRFSKHVREENL